MKLIREQRSQPELRPPERIVQTNNSDLRTVPMWQESLFPVARAKIVSEKYLGKVYNDFEVYAKDLLKNRYTTTNELRQVTAEDFRNISLGLCRWILYYGEFPVEFLTIIICMLHSRNVEFEDIRFVLNNFMNAIVKPQTWHNSEIDKNGRWTPHVRVAGSPPFVNIREGGPVMEAVGLLRGQLKHQYGKFINVFMVILICAVLYLIKKFAK